MYKAEKTSVDCHVADFKELMSESFVQNYCLCKSC